MDAQIDLLLDRPQRLQAIRLLHTPTGTESGCGTASPSEGIPKLPGAASSYAAEGIAKSPGKHATASCIARWLRGRRRSRRIVRLPSKPSHIPSRRIAKGLRVAIDIGIRIQALRIALRRIRREEHPHHRVIVARMQVIQPRAIVVLSNEALRGIDAARVVPPTAIRPEELIALERGPTCRVGEGRDKAAQRVRQVELRAVAVQRTEQTPGQKGEGGEVGSDEGKAAYLTLSSDTSPMHFPSKTDDDWDIMARCSYSAKQKLGNVY